MLRAALAALGGLHAAGLQRSFDVLEDGEPGEEREALEDDGDVDVGGGDGLAVPVDLAAGGLGEAGEHAQQGGFAGAGGAEQRDDLSRRDGEVGRRDDLDAVLARLRIIFLNAFCAYDCGCHNLFISELGRKVKKSKQTMTWCPAVSVSLGQSERANCSIIARCLPLPTWFIIQG